MIAFPFVFSIRDELNISIDQGYSKAVNAVLASDSTFSEVSRVKLNAVLYGCGKYVEPDLQPIIHNNLNHQQVLYIAELAIHKMKQYFTNEIQKDHELALLNHAVCAKIKSDVTIQFNGSFSQFTMEYE